MPPTNNAQYSRNNKTQNKEGGKTWCDNEDKTIVATTTCTAESAFGEKVENQKGVKCIFSPHHEFSIIVCVKNHPLPLPSFKRKVNQKIQNKKTKRKGKKEREKKRKEEKRGKTKEIRRKKVKKGEKGER